MNCEHTVEKVGVSTRIIYYVLTVFACLTPLNALAQDGVYPYEEYDKNIQQRSVVAALGSDLFGERISLNNGDMEVVQTDVDLPGNNAIPVRVQRRLQSANIYNKGHFGFWNLDIPSVHGVFAMPTAWVTGYSGADAYKRCSLFGAPPDVQYQQDAWFAPKEYWHGTFFYLPDAGDREMLDSSEGGHVPNDGNAYSASTKDGAVTRCVALADTSEAAGYSQGEGFEVVTPDGMVYTLNQMVSRNVSALKKYTPGPSQITAGNHAQHNTSEAGTTLHGRVGNPTLADGFVLPRHEFFLFPTRVADRFGNAVTYTWNPDNAWQLQRISASDGRHLDFTYLDESSIEIATVSDGLRTWTYSYAGDLTGVALPDGSAWSFNITDFARASVVPSGVSCDGMNTGGLVIGSITHPSGAKAEFTLSRLMFGRSWVPRVCTDGGDGTSGPAEEPYLFVSLAIMSKKITGPGLPSAGLLWSYSYGSPHNCWSPASHSFPNGAVLCTASSPTTRTVSVTDPANTVTRYTFGNRFHVDEGLLLKTEYGWSDTSALRTETITYASPEAEPYAAFNGGSIRDWGDAVITNKLRPVRQISIAQQSRTFIWQVASDCNGMPYCFDTYARPTKVIKISAPSL